MRSILAEYRREKISTFMRFALIGGLTAILYFLVMWLSSSRLHLGYEIAVSVAYLISTTFHFLANKYFTFKSASEPSHMQLIKYGVMWIINYIITVAVVWLAVEKFAFSAYVGVCMAVVMTFMVGFILGQCWVFKKEVACVL